MSEQIAAIKNAVAATKVSPVTEYLDNRNVHEIMGTKKYLAPSTSFIATVAGGLVATVLLTAAVAKLNSRNA